ncbi:hypothetical protein JCM10296v2_005964 [Rhodotorula toruloides]
MSSAYSLSGTPATDRRYMTSAAPSSSARGGRLTRGMKGVLLLAALAVLIIAIVPAAVVTTRKDDKNLAAQDSSAGYTTVINGVTTFIQTSTASIVTRSSFSTLPNGRISTVLQEVTLPVVTVSATAAGAVQTGFETVTIDGQAVVVATQTQYVAGGQVVVTRTLLNGPQAIETVYSTAFQDLTVTSKRNETAELASKQARLGIADHNLRSDLFLYDVTRAVHLERTINIEPAIDEPVEQLFDNSSSAVVFFIFLELAYRHEPRNDEPAADHDFAGEQLDYPSHQRQPDIVDSYDLGNPNDDKRCLYLRNPNQHLAHDHYSCAHLESSMHSWPSPPARRLPRTDYDLLSSDHYAANVVSHDSCAVEHHNVEQYARRLHAGIASASGRYHNDAGRPDLHSWPSSASRRLRDLYDAGALADLHERYRTFVDLKQRLDLPRTRLRVELANYDCAVDPHKQLFVGIGDDDRPRVVFQLDSLCNKHNNGRSFEYHEASRGFLVLLFGLQLLLEQASDDDSPCTLLHDARQLVELSLADFVQL